MNLLQLETRVRSLLDEPDPLGFFSSEEIRAWINEGQLTIARTAKHLKGFASTSTTGRGNYLLPDDFLELYKVLLNKRALRSVNVDSSDSGYFLWEDRNIHLVGGDSPGNLLELFYYRKPSEITDDLSSPEIPPEYESLLIEYALSKAKIKDNKPDEANVHEQRFYRDLSELALKSSSKPGQLRFKPRS